jgi:hypothetical protein
MERRDGMRIRNSYTNIRGCFDKTFLITVDDKKYRIWKRT